MLVGQFADENQRENFRSLLREGTLNDRTIEIEVPRPGPDGKGGVGGPGGSFTYDGNNPGFIADQIFKLAKSGNGSGKRPEKKKMTIAEASLSLRILKPSACSKIVIYPKRLLLVWRRMALCLLMRSTSW